MDRNRAARYISWSRVDEASSHLAIHTKGELSEEDLRKCFSIMCGPDADENLWQRFRSVYRTHQPKTRKRQITLRQAYTSGDGLELLDSSVEVE